MGRRIRARSKRRTNRRNTMKRKHTMKRRMRRNTMRRRNTMKRRRNTMKRRKNTRRNFRWMGGSTDTSSNSTEVAQREAIEARRRAELTEAVRAGDSEREIEARRAWWAAQTAVRIARREAERKAEVEAAEAQAAELAAQMACPPGCEPTTKLPSFSEYLQAGIREVTSDKYDALRRFHHLLVRVRTWNELYDYVYDFTKKAYTDKPLYNFLITEGVIAGPMVTPPPPNPALMINS